MSEEEKAAAAAMVSPEGAKNIIATTFDKVKGPVFWLALGYVVCKYTDRKRLKVL